MTLGLVLGRLERALERDQRRFELSRVAQDPAAQHERVGVRLQRERAVEREQRAGVLTHAMGRVGQLVPGEREVAVPLERALERAHRLARAAQLGERRALERERHRRLGAEVRRRGFGRGQGLGVARVAPQQLEQLHPAGGQIGIALQRGAILTLRGLGTALAPVPSGLREVLLAGIGAKHGIRRREPHGAG